jgi:glucose-1-phosphate adenylyltransferase
MAKAKAFGIVTSTPRRVKVYGLQDYRPAGAFSFSGRYRVVDFPISNLSNSGIDNIQVYLNEHPRSLTDHLGSGRQYNINSKKGSLQLLFCDHSSRNEVYNTDVADYLANMDFLSRQTEPYVVITPCYMVFKQNFSEMLDTHIESGADITMLYQKISNGRDHYLNLRVMNVDKEGKVTSLAENRGNKAAQTVFLDSYIMKRELFLDLIKQAREYSSTCSLSQLLEHLCGGDQYDIRGVQHKGYLAGCGDLQAYYDANMELLDIKTAKALFSEDWPIFTKTADSCPTQIFEGASVSFSMISDGCEIEGTVENSIIGRGVKIGKGAVVKDSIVLAYAEIGPDVKIEYQVVDKWAKIYKTKELVGRKDDPGYVRKSDVL